jgi:hypothetical protein
VLLYIDPLAFVLERDQALAAERDLIPCWFREEMDQGIDPLVTEVIQDQFERPGIVIEKNRLVTFDCYGVPLKKLSEKCAMGREGCNPCLKYFASDIHHDFIRLAKRDGRR